MSRPQGRPQRRQSIKTTPVNRLRLCVSTVKYQLLIKPGGNAIGIYRFIMTP
jgi:hypothetical protein